jgi:hypothetical protein
LGGAVQRWSLGGLTMKAFLITTGILFGLMAVVHIWRAIAEWPQSSVGFGFVLGMAALIVVPGALSEWAWWCLCKLPDKTQNKDSDDSAN